jgi:GNAT superfamily N-acetyltransferase
MISVTLDLPDGYIDVPAGKIAAIQTFLEMRERPPERPDPSGVTATLRQVEKPGVDWYGALFHKVGDEYLWYFRLAMNDDELHAIINDPNEEVYVVEQNGSEEGLLELDFRTPGECEISYFGLTSKLVGTGVGRWLMNRSLERAWSQPIARFWVHTCSIDHPNALAFYRRSGFIPYERKIEIGDDPRIAGLVPRNAAPQIPLIPRAS